MSELTPITRVESYLDAIVNNGIPPTEDITRIETFLQAIYDNQVCALTPITRIEMFLGKISGQSLTLPEPVTRVELYLAAIAGEDVELPENPITRLEMYLAEWADSGDWATISGAIVEFITQRAHKLKSCVVSLSPQQDLHGYDSPWPAGGGVNKFDGQIEHGALDPATGEKTPNAERYRSTNFIGVKPSTRYRISVNGTATSANIYSYDANKTFLSNVERPYTNDFTTGADTYFIMFFGTNALNSDKVQIEEGSSVTAFAPYSNICPISGWTGCEVWRTGANLFNKETITDNAYVNTQGQVMTGFTEFFCSDYISVKPETAYYIFTDINGRMDTIRFYDANKTVIGGSAYQKRVVTTPAKCAYIRINAIKSHISADEVFFNYPSTDTEYHAYKGNSYSVTWEDEAGTVYGGTVDVVSGVLTVDRASYTFVGDEAFELAENDQVEIFNFFCWRYSNFTNRVQNWNVLNDATMSCYPVENQVPYWYSGGIRKDNCAWTVKNYAGLCIRNDSIATTEELKSSLIGQTICYKLSTPITIQLTPQQVSALKGYNAVWSDAGDIEVTVHGTPVEVETLQALNMLLGGAYHNNQTADDVSDDEALDIILGGENR